MRSKLRLRRRNSWRRGAGIVLVLGAMLTVSLDAQPGSKRFRLAYVLLLDVRGADPTFDERPVDGGMAEVKSTLELRFRDSVVVYVRALADSGRACRGITVARDCDVVILHQTRDEADPEKRRLARLEWMRGPKHRGIIEPVHKPLQCQSDFASCRFLLSPKIVGILDRHFHSPEFTHTTP
jgi:hypothetical protein